MMNPYVHAQMMKNKMYRAQHLRGVIGHAPKKSSLRTDKPSVGQVLADWAAEPMNEEQQEHAEPDEDEQKPRLRASVFTPEEVARIKEIRAATAQDALSTSVAEEEPAEEEDEIESEAAPAPNAPPAPVAGLVEPDDAYDAVPETTTEHVRYSIQSWRYKSNHPKTFSNFKDAWDFLKNNDIPSFGANSTYLWTMEHDSSEACFSNPETLEGVKIYNVMWTRDSHFLYPLKLYKFIVEHRWTE